VFARFSAGEQAFTIYRTSPKSDPVVPGQFPPRHSAFTYFPARDVVAAPFFERTSAGLQCECGPAILRHERHGPENNLPLPQIRVLFPRLPAARKKDAGQDSWLGRSLPSPSPPLFVPGRQSHVRVGRSERAAVLTLCKRPANYASQFAIKCENVHRNWQVNGHACRRLRFCLVPKLEIFSFFRSSSETAKR
jgi:hypothetical protein